MSVEVAAVGHIDGDQALATETGWELMSQCRSRAQEASSLTFTHPVPELTTHWHPLGVGHGDLGVALALSVADALDPDGDWDSAAHTHVAAAVTQFRRAPDLGIGLFTGTAAVAWMLRSLSREGTRYQGALRAVDEALNVRMREVLARTDRAGGVRVNDVDMVSGLAGAITYARAWGVEALAEVSQTALVTLARRALDDWPRGLWTGPAEVEALDVRLNPRVKDGYQDLGAAHGAAGVLNVLGQAADRGVGGPIVAEAALALADHILSVSTTSSEINVPYLVLPPTSSREISAEKSRHAWCYGNLGVALAFTHSELLRATHPDAVVGLLGEPGSEPDRHGVTEAGICHGWAGAYLLERQLLGDASARGSLAGLLALRDHSTRFGLRTSPDGQVWVDSPGFLDESGGAAAVLIAAGSSSSDLPAALRMITGQWQ